MAAGTAHGPRQRGRTSACAGPQTPPQITDGREVAPLTEGFPVRGIRHPSLGGVARRARRVGRARRYIFADALRRFQLTVIMQRGGPTRTSLRDRLTAADLDGARFSLHHLTGHGRCGVSLTALLAGLPFFHAAVDAVVAIALVADPPDRRRGQRPCAGLDGVKHTAAELRRIAPVPMMSSSDESYESNHSSPRTPGLTSLIQPGAPHGDQDQAVAPRANRVATSASRSPSRTPSRSW